MQTLFALGLAAAAAAIVIARPPGPLVTTGSQDEPVPHSPTGKYLKDYLMPQYLWPQYFAYDESPRTLHQYRQPSMPATDWLNQEIERLSRKQQRAIHPFNVDITKISSKPMFMKRMLRPEPFEVADRLQPYFEQQSLPKWNMMAEQTNPKIFELNDIVKPVNAPSVEKISQEEKNKNFALTPRDEGYLEQLEKDTAAANALAKSQEEEGQQEEYEGSDQLVTDSVPEVEPPRQIRQNPNLSRTKTLVAEDVDKLKIGLSNKEYRLPVSLLPSNLRWLKQYRPIEVNQSGHENVGMTDIYQNIRVREASAPDVTGSFYDVALISAIGAAVVMAFLGFAFGWYTLSKRAKAAADVDYPAYGVTGPSIDSSGDRKLAHSAHMYHYQHQKQQIIAMERSGMDQHNGSVSDPESEEENEEGDYTVYECPGFATTGDMEVKNPLFNEDPTPVTPGKCEVVKPQPKD